MENIMEKVLIEESWLKNKDIDKEGLLCYHKTWGFGIISDVDYFYDELEVNFDKKKDHTISFSYAIEGLEILDDNHILSIKHRTPEILDEKIKNEPKEIIRLALESYGRMTVVRLTDCLVPSIISEDQWKKFWDNARKQLKNDASIEIPKKRTDFIELHQGTEYDDDWFNKLSVENDIERLFIKFKDIIDREIDISSDVAQNILSERLAYIIKGAPASKPEWKAESFIFAELLSITPQGLDTDIIIHDLIENNLGSMLENLPSRQLETFLGIIIGNDKETVIKHLKYIVPKVGYTVFNEIMNALSSFGASTEAKKIISTALAHRKASSSMLMWCQRSDLFNKWGLISESDLAFHIQENLEKDLSGILLRSQNQLRENFQKEEWLHQVMQQMSELQRRDFMRRIFEGRGWESLDRKSLMAKILRKFPDLQDIVIPSGTAPKKEVFITSSRSFREKQQQLEKLMKVDIPENSKEIELARSYGDLKENAEFKYAKERQTLLMAQGTQLAEDLEKVKPSDFKDVSTNKVAMGTGVRLRFEDNNEVHYYILGMWDQDDELNIISSETRLAKVLMNSEENQKINLPDGQIATLVEITKLSNEICNWISS